MKPEAPCCCSRGWVQAVQPGTDGGATLVIRLSGQQLLVRDVAADQVLEQGLERGSPVIVKPGGQVVRADHHLRRH